MFGKQRAYSACIRLVITCVPFLSKRTPRIRHKQKIQKKVLLFVYLTSCASHVLHDYDNTAHVPAMSVVIILTRFFIKVYLFTVPFLRNHRY